MYLYRNECRQFIEASKIRRIVVLFLLLIVAFFYFVTPAKNLMFFRDMLFLGLCFFCVITFNPKWLRMKGIKFIGSISFEIYLVHMVIYRGIEKVLGVYPFGNGWISFMSVLCLDLIGSFLFIFIYLKGLGLFVKKEFEK